MNDFTASNGTRITEADGETRLYLSSGPNSLAKLDYLGSGDMRALREFFQAEADERLGRWRSAVDPDFVVYEPREGQPARVLRESTAQALDYRRSETRSTHPSAFESVARAYFAAHPEPKPWHNAKPGELWVIRLADEEEIGVSVEAYEPGADVFQVPGGESISITRPSIVAGHRIWPEVAS